MQQLAHAAAFLTAVMPPVYLCDVAEDGCWPLIYRQTRGQQRVCCEFWLWNSRCILYVGL